MATDELIAALCAEGRVDSRGGFSLDRDKAREKLRTFQVAEPHRYVLHLVALAVLRGATRIAFEIDTDDLWARFDGAPLTEHDFEDLYSSSFAAAGSEVERARQQLAVGLNAALALNPRHVRVTSGPPGGRVRLEARHGAEDRITRVPEDRDMGTVVHVKQRFRPGLAVRFLRHVRGDMLEEIALRERVAFAHVPVTIDGAPIGRADPLAGLVQHQRQVRDGEGRVCVVGLRDDPHAQAEVRLVRHGVWVSTLHLPHLPGGILAVARDDSLQTDLSGQEVVHNAARDRCLALVELAAEASLLDYLRDPGRDDRWLRARLVRSWLKWPRMRDATTPLGTAMAAVPWWRDIFGAPVSLAMLRAALERQQAVYYTPAEFAERLEKAAEMVIATPPKAVGVPCDDVLILRELFGDKLRDRTRELEREVRRGARRRLWRARPTTPVLEPSRYSALAAIRVETPARPLEGQVGLRRDRSGPSMVRVIVDGHLLCELGVDLPLPIDAVLAGVEADDDYEGPRRDDRLALALLALLDAGLELVESDMSQRTSSEIDANALALARGWLRLRHAPEASQQWLQRFGFREPQAIEAAGHPRVPALPRVRPKRTPVTAEQLLAPWLAECEKFPTSCGRFLGVGALALALARGDRVVWTDEPVLLAGPPDRIVLMLDRSAEALVEQLFGAAIPRLGSKEIEALAAEHRFMARPAEEPALPKGLCAAEVRIVDGPLRAVLGLKFFRAGEPPPASVRVLVRGRKLDEREVWAPFGGIVAVVQDDRLTPSADWDEVVRDAAWRAVEQALFEAMPLLTAEALRRAPLIVMLDVLAASFPSQALRRAWERLIEVEGASMGEGSYELLLGLASQVQLERLDEVLERALRVPARSAGERRVHPIGNIAKIADDCGSRIDPARARTIANVLREIRSLCGQQRPGASLGRQVLAGGGPLVHEQTFRRSDGAVVTLAALIEQHARGQAIEYVRSGRADEGSVDPHVLCLARVDEERLLRLFGEGALRPASSGSKKIAQLRAPALPTAPGDALAIGFVRGSDVGGWLWIPAGAEEEDCRVGLYTEDGALQRRVSLLPPLPLAGAVVGSGVWLEGFKVEMSTEALQAVRDAAWRLYDALLQRSDPAVLLAVRRISGRIGGARMPQQLEPLRDRLRQAAGAGQHESVPPSPPNEHDLADIFAALEAAARERANSAAPAVIDPPPPLSPPGTPDVRLLEAIRTELRALRERHERLLSNFNLEHLRLVAAGPRAEAVILGAEAVVLNTSHSLVERAAAEFDRDPWWVDILASLVFTAFNVWRDEITDADEQAFHHSHLERVARRIATRG
ncbi:hypothetical protein [Nannocystis punicea]|uniref:Uncharacterized protein n=1 Tax=Nannocystis punicea TaxID=2995304 RepID=A0ABY7HI23_9BACT|nr:hypothetical protein [Nannocystis poenicansa]WAS98748.1 hypothetical protein O0S08_21665 [Nannocystis poenicansa]